MSILKVGDKIRFNSGGHPNGYYQRNHFTVKGVRGDWIKVQGPDGKLIDVNDSNVVMICETCAKTDVFSHGGARKCLDCAREASDVAYRQFKQALSSSQMVLYLKYQRERDRLRYLMDLASAKR